MVKHHPARFGVHRQSGSGDITFQVVEEQDCSCYRLNPLLLFISV